LEFPTDRPRPAQLSGHGARLSRLLPLDLSNALKELRRSEGVTLFMMLLAGFQILLNYYTGQEDIAIGTDISNRNRGETEGLLGFFANQLVMRTDLSGNPSFQQLLNSVRETALEAYANQDVQFDTLVKTLQPKRDAGRTPLFQVKLVLQNAPLAQLELPGITLTPLEFETHTSKFDLLLSIKNQPHGLACLLEYNTDLFDSNTITRFLERFEIVLGIVVAQPEIRIDEVREKLAASDREHLTTKRKELKASRRDKLRELSLKY
jgi:non-ribosomal peptide synthetase component F